MFELPLLPRTLEAAARDLTSNKERVRLDAVRDLSRSRDGESEERLRLLLLAVRDAAPEVRRAALLALADHGTAVPLSSLLPLLTEGDLGVRQMALLALGECAPVGDAEALGALRPVLTAHEAKLRFQAISAYFRLAPEEAEEVLGDALRDDDALIRQLALRLFEERAESQTGVLGNDSWARILACLTDANPGVRLLAELLLLDFGREATPTEIVRVIERKLRPPLPGDEQLCIEVAGRLRLSETRRGLLRRARGFFGVSFDPFRYQARAALAALGEPGFLEGILDGLRNGASREANLLLFAVGRVRLVEALPLLREGRVLPPRVDPEVLRVASEELEAAEKLEKPASTLVSGRQL